MRDEAGGQGVPVMAMMTGDTVLLRHQPARQLQHWLCISASVLWQQPQHDQSQSECQQPWGQAPEPEASVQRPEPTWTVATGPACQAWPCSAVNNEHWENRTDPQTWHEGSWLKCQINSSFILTLINNEWSKSFPSFLIPCKNRFESLS